MVPSMRVVPNVRNSYSNFREVVPLAQAEEGVMDSILISFLYCILCCLTGVIIGLYVGKKECIRSLENAATKDDMDKLKAVINDLENDIRRSAR